MPLVVMDMDTSIITGPSGEGQPAASGFGVYSRRVPPNGATLAVDGSEQATSSIRPRLGEAGRRYAARQPMCPLRRIDTEARPVSAERATAQSLARRASHGPGSWRPSQVCAAVASATMSGSPWPSIRPAAASAA